MEIRVYPSADGEFTLYEDENYNYNYEKGAYSTITFKWNDKAQKLTIDKRKRSYKGMKSRIFNIVLVNKAKGTGATSTSKFDKTINYSENAKSVKIL